MPSELQTWLPGILLAYTTYILATASPGPALMAVMSTSMSVGRRPGLQFGMGVVTGSVCWGLMAAVGVSALLTAYPGALDIVRVVGGLYLAWLAFKAGRSALSDDPLAARTTDGAHRSGLGWFLRGWAIHLFNPKAIMAWIAIITLGLGGGAPPWVAAVILSGTGLFALTFYSLAAVAFSTPVVVSAYSRARRWIDAILACFFAFGSVMLLAARL